MATRQKQPPRPEPAGYELALWLAASDGDDVALLALADHLAEGGWDGLSSTLRWMHRTGRRPARRQAFRDGPVEWFWFCKGSASIPLGVHRDEPGRVLATLPRTLFYAGDRVPGPYIASSAYHRAVEWLDDRLQALRRITDGDLKGAK